MIRVAYPFKEMVGDTFLTSECDMAITTQQTIDQPKLFTCKHAILLAIKLLPRPNPKRMDGVKQMLVSQTNLPKIVHKHAVACY